MKGAAVKDPFSGIEFDFGKTNSAASSLILTKDFAWENYRLLGKSKEEFERDWEKAVKRQSKKLR